MKPPSNQLASGVQYKISRRSLSGARCVNCRLAWLPEVVRQLGIFKQSAGAHFSVGIPHTKTRHSLALPIIGV